ncbi:TPA: flavodoxin family protein [Vibrio vulnificus]
MKKIAVVYFSKTDITHQLAQAIIAGIHAQDVQVVEHRIERAAIIEGRFEHPELFEALLSCDAIIFGSPTYMGGVSAQFKAFADASSEFWADQRWANKLAAGFTSGDQSSTLQYLTTFAAQHGMLWVNLDVAGGFSPQGLNRLGQQSGVVAQGMEGQAHPSDLATAQYLGERVAHWVTRL